MRSVMSTVRVFFAAIFVVAMCACGEPDVVAVTPPAAIPSPVLVVSPNAEAVVRGWFALWPDGAPELLILDEALAFGMLVRGDVDAAVVHRRASPEELRDANGATVDAYGLEHILLARDSIALAVHTTNPLHAVTRDEARKLILGEMAWADFPGPPPVFGGPALALPEGPTTVYLRGPRDSSRRALSLLRVKTAAVSVSLGTDEAVVDSLVEDPAGLAIVPVSALSSRLDGARGKVLALQQDGVLVFPDAGRKGGPIWPLLRPLYLVRLSGSEAFEPLARAAASPKGKQVTAAAGFLPASPVGPKPRRGAP
jgi:hypothetical protein